MSKKPSYTLSDLIAQCDPDAPVPQNMVDWENSAQVGRRCTDEELINKKTLLSGVFGVENAGHSWEALQQAVDRVVKIIEADPNKERVDKIITRWIKRHLSRLGANE